MSHTFTIPADHPALPGHFPGHPLVPGVVILDQVLQAAGSSGVSPAGIATAKFTAPLGPDEVAEITLQEQRGRLAFTVQRGETTIASGTLLLNPPPSERV